MLIKKCYMLYTYVYRIIVSCFMKYCISAYVLMGLVLLGTAESSALGSWDSEQPNAEKMEAEFEAKKKEQVHVMNYLVSDFSAKSAKEQEKEIRASITSNAAKVYYNFIFVGAILCAGATGEADKMLLGKTVLQTTLKALVDMKAGTKE